MVRLNRIYSGRSGLLILVVSLAPMLMGRGVYGANTNATSRPAAEFPATVSILSHLDALRQLTATFSFKDKVFNDPGFTTMPAGSGTISPSRDRDGEMRLQLLDGRGLWDTRWSAASAARIGLQRDAVVFNGDRVEALVDRGSKRFGMIMGSAGTKCTLLEEGLALRPLEFPSPARAGPTSRPWLDKNRINQMTEWLDDAGNAFLQWSARNALTYRWTFRRDLGFAMSRCDIVTSTRGALFADVVCSDFRKVEEVMVPFTIQVRRYRPRDGKIIAESVAHVKDFKLNDPSNTPDAYAMRWPKGATVTDARVNVNIYVDHDDYVITDAMSAQLAAEPPARRAARSIEPVAPVGATQAVRHNGLRPVLAMGAIIAAVSVGLVLVLLVTWRRKRGSSLRQEP